MSKAQIIEVHCSEAAFLWRLRDNAVRDRAYSLQRLAELDARIDAHLDGLVLAGAEGWAACAAMLEEPTPGAVFTALFVAMGRRDGAALGHACRDGAALPRVLEVASQSPRLQRAAAAALAWLPLSEVIWLLPYLFAGGGAAHRQYLGLTGCALHRHDPGDPVLQALSSEGLCARALRAFGELGRHDALSDLSLRYQAEDEDLKYWACWSGSLLGDPHAPEHLLAIGCSGSPRARGACETAMRRLDLTSARRWLEWVLAHAQPRVALAGVAALGDPSLVPWLLELMVLPELSRLAAEAMHRMTGVDFSKRPLRGSAPEGFRAKPSDDPEDDDVEIDPDDSLPWPDRGAAERWWRSARGGLQAGTRYLLGKPVSEVRWLEAVLRDGSQPARAAAAEELSISGARGPLFEVRARAARQLEVCAHG